jgi:hypothetical protein
MILIKMCGYQLNAASNVGRPNGRPNSAILAFREGLAGQAYVLGMHRHSLWYCLLRFRGVTVEWPAIAF